MFRYRYVWRWTAVFFLTGLAACSSVKPPELPHDLPTSYLDASGLPAAPAPDFRNWWKAFNDPMLNQLVDRALAQNLNVAQAGSRLRQARILAGRANAVYLPELTAGTRSAQIPSATETYLQASLDAVWELGLFGAREATALGAQASVDAAAADEQAARVSVVAEVVRSYLDLRAAQQQLALLQDMARLDAQALRLIDVRIQTRLSSADERDSLLVTQADTLAELSQPREALAHAALGLAVLLGQTEPDPAWYLVGQQPSLDRLAIDQVPADLLSTRPEIRKAETAVNQASSELGLAHADLYPHVALGASYLTSLNLTRDAHSRFNTGLSFGPIIDVPLFDWGRRKDEFRARKEALDASVLAYRQALLEGVSEVQRALVSLDAQAEREIHLNDALTVLDKRTATQTTLARLGLSSEFDGVGAGRAALQARLDLTVTRARHDLAFVALYKSLGGAPLPLADADQGKTP